MLADAPVVRLSERVFRVALCSGQHGYLSQVAKDVGQGAPFQEALDYMAELFLTIPVPDLDQMLTYVFDTPPREGRYSSGAHPVLYAARDRDTAATEYAHYVGGYYAPPDGESYEPQINVIDFEVNADARDLVTMQDRWPWLTYEDRSNCHKLGAEAVVMEVGAFLAPSARRRDGVTVPIFRREVSSRPRKLGNVTYSIVAKAAPPPPYRFDF